MTDIEYTECIDSDEYGKADKKSLTPPPALVANEGKKAVLEKGSSIVLKGFTTKRGDTVSGKLVLGEDMRVRVEIEK